MTHPGRRLALLLAAGLPCGVAGSLLGSACVIPDSCPVIATPGTDWCVTMDGAQMWPPGQPELAEPVLSENDIDPTGCRCMNDIEHAIMANPGSDERDALIAELEQEARYACIVAVNEGWENNCFTDPPEPLAPTFPAPVSKGEPSYACFGSCSFAGKNCGADPDPFACNEEFGDGETGTVESEGGDPPREVDLDPPGEVSL